MRHVANLLEEHHGRPILESAKTASLKLSVRYMSHLRLPDKAITLSDSACSRVIKIIQ